jgi:hypothetical protein
VAVPILTPRVMDRHRQDVLQSAHLKNWKILATGCRGRLSELPNIIRIITALEFYRLGW